MKIKLLNPILLYHSTFSKTPDSLKGNIHNVLPEIVIKQVLWLKQYFDLVSLEELYSSKQKFGKCSITFDDAYKCIFIEVIPKLIELKVPVTIFINSGSFENKLFWRDKVRYLISNNLTFDFIQDNCKFCKRNNISIENFYARTKNFQINTKEFNYLLNDFFEKKLNKKFVYENHLIDTNKELILSEFIKYGNHSRNHFLLSSLNKQHQNEEINTCHEFLHNSLDIKYISSLFSVPFGTLNSFNSNTIYILQKLQYKGLLLSRNRINNLFKSSYDKKLGINISERFMPVNDLRGFKKQFLSLGIKSLFNK